jgi:hypothetical protein
MPKPSYTKGGSKFLEVKDTETSTIFWFAHHFPILAFPTGDLVAGRPKESPSYAINLLERFNRDV